MASMIKKLSGRKQFDRSDPTPEEISKLAYELYLQRGGDHGKDREDWLQAEMLLREKRTN